MRLRTALLATLAATVLPLTAACGTDEDTPTKPAATTEAGTDEAEDGAEGPAEEPAAQADGDLKVGQTHTYKDGLAVTVTAITGKVQLDEYSEPEPGHKPFKVELKMVNDSKAPVDLDAWGYAAEGATTGGMSGHVTLADEQMMTGRLAPGKEGVFNFGYSLAEEDGTEVVFTLTRMDEEADWSLDDPTWIGSIK